MSIKILQLPLRCIYLKHKRTELRLCYRIISDLLTNDLYLECCYTYEIVGHYHTANVAQSDRCLFLRAITVV